MTELLSLEIAWKKSRRRISRGDSPPSFDARHGFFSVLTNTIAQDGFVGFEIGGAGRTAIVPIGIKDDGRAYAIRVSYEPRVRLNLPFVQDPEGDDRPLTYHDARNGIDRVLTNEVGQPLVVQLVEKLAPSRDPADVLAMLMYIYQNGEYYLGDAKPNNLGVDSAGKLKIIDAGLLKHKPATGRDITARRLALQLTDIVTPDFIETANVTDAPLHSSHKRIAVIAGKNEDDFIEMEKKASTAGLFTFRLNNYGVVRSFITSNEPDMAYIPHLLVVVDPSQTRFGADLIKDILPAAALRPQSGTGRKAEPAIRHNNKS